MTRGVSETIRRAAVAVAAVAILLGLVAAAGPASAQYRFSRVVIEGNQRVEPRTIITYAGLRPGEPVDQAALDDAFQRLMGSGLFESVELVPSGNRLIIRVKEWPTINRISIEGNRRIKDDVLMTLVQSKPRQVFRPSRAEADAAAIAAAYRQQGRIEAEVTPRIIRREGNRVDLVFEVVEGPVSEIQRISFVGNRHFSDRRLRRVLASRQVTLLHQFIRSDTYVADRLELDKQLLRDFYLSRGFVDVEIVSATAEMARDRSGFFVTFVIREGQPFRFGAIDVRSEIKTLPPEPFRRLIRFGSGDIYSPVHIDKAMSQMEALAAKAGERFVRVEPVFTRHDDKGTIDVTFVIKRGPKVFVERIDIEGNVTTLDRVIRRQFRIVEGDPLNPREVRAAAERIRALGFFSKVDVTPREGSAPDRVIIDVNVEEQPTGSFGFGVSYSVSTGPGLLLKFSEKNFLGRGQALDASVGFGISNQDYFLRFREPAFLGRDVGFSLGALYQTTNNFNAGFDTTDAGANIGFDFPVGEFSRVSLGYDVRKTTLTNDGSTSTLVLGDVGSWTTSALSFGYSFDTRGKGLDPTRGVVAELKPRLAVLGGSNRYIALEGHLGGEMMVLNEEVTLRADLEYGFIRPVGQTATRITDRFFLVGKMRGFERRGIGPRENGEALGGNRYVVARLEAQFPLGLPEEYNISGGAFLDVGSVWGLNVVPVGVDASFKPRAAVGFSVFWTTPIGPLRFNFAHPLIKQAGDRTQFFDLAIESRF
ncbi:MAG: outer membrane protein assembly factor BamA [Alphaproteobacteria bacterium]|nr:MAG: outer membrane protein assembly factor BamA [Alphaproteobacteria bacterium]